MVSGMKLVAFEELYRLDHPTADLDKLCKIGVNTRSRFLNSSVVPYLVMAEATHSLPDRDTQTQTSLRQARKNMLRDFLAAATRQVSSVSASFATR